MFFMQEKKKKQVVAFLKDDHFPRNLQIMAIIIFGFKTHKWDWDCGSVIMHLPNKHKVRSPALHCSNRN